MAKYIFQHEDHGICYHNDNPGPTRKQLIELAEDFEFQIIKFPPLAVTPLLFVFNEITEQWEWQKLTHSNKHIEFADILYGNESEKLNASK